MGHEPILFPQHTVSLTVALGMVGAGGGMGEEVPSANIFSCPAREITALLGQMPGTCELGASCS